MADKTVLIEQTKRILREQSYYRSVGALMSWDLWQGLSEDGRPFRGEVSGYFTRQAREHLVSRETAQVVGKLEEIPVEEFQSPYERAAVKLLIKSFQRAVRIPASLQVEMDEFLSLIHISRASKTGISRSGCGLLSAMVGPDDRWLS